MFPTLSNLILHILNIVVIFVIVYFLAYKPVLNFIKKRNSALEERKNEANEKLRKAKEMESEYQKILDNAGEIAERERAVAQETTKATCDAMISEAKKNAKQLIEEASEKAEKDRILALRSAEKEISENAVKLAGEILKREISKEDNEKIIDSFINQVG